MPRLRHLFWLFVFISLCGCSRAAETPVATPATSVIPTALDDYVARAQPHYTWEKVSEKAGALNTVTTLRVVSQTWQGSDWTHSVEVVRPQKNDYPDTAIVMASYGSPGESLLGQLLANKTGATVVTVNNVPNQPLWGMREDDLIAYTLQKFLETGDTSWPLLLPMTKSVTACMDAVGEFSAKNLDKPLTKFVVGGASKRGWTAWLVAAADSKSHPGRVIGIVPLVYNNLNIPKQMPYQLESWGKYSDQIADYTRRGLQAQLVTPRGQELVAIIDPYTYRERFTMPKLLINGTNDPYWTPDATRFYLNDLPGPTSLYFVPNAGHDLGGKYEEVFTAAAEWAKWVMDYREIPKINIKTSVPLKINDRARTVWVESSTVLSGRKVVSAALWAANSATRDFRGEKWLSIEMEERSGKYYLNVPPAPTDKTYSAVFVEIKYDGAPALQLTTPVVIWNEKELKPTSAKKTNICPLCNSKNYTISVPYGHPSGDVIERYLRGVALLDGCEPNRDKWYCKTCDRYY